MTTVVVGLGNLGLAVARRLVASGCTVVGVDPVPARRDAWLDAGGTETHADLAGTRWQEVESVFVVVRLTEQVADVLDDAARRAPRRTPCFVLTTLDVRYATGLGGQTALDIVELPVSGGAAGALAGDLTVMAAGPLTAERRAFLRSTLATHLVEFDRYGQPTLVKLINNVVSAYNASSLAEMLLLAAKLDVDPARAYEVIVTATGGSSAAENFASLMEDLLDKDIQLLRAAVGELPVIDLSGDLARRLAAGRASLEPGRSP